MMTCPPKTSPVPMLVCRGTGVEKEAGHEYTREAAISGGLYHYMLGLDRVTRFELAAFCLGPGTVARCLPAVRGLTWRW